MSHRRRLPADLRCRRDNRKGRNDLLHAGWNTQRAFQMSADSKIIPAVSFKTAQTGASAKSDELGMRPMQAQAYEKRGEAHLLIKSPPASGKSRALRFIDRKSNRPNS